MFTHSLRISFKNIQNINHELSWIFWPVHLTELNLKTYLKLNCYYSNDDDHTLPASDSVLLIESLPLLESLFPPRSARWTFFVKNSCTRHGVISSKCMDIYWSIPSAWNDISCIWNKTFWFIRFHYSSFAHKCTFLNELRNRRCKQKYIKIKWLKKAMLTTIYP